MPPLSGSSGYGPGTSYTNAGGADYGPAAMAQALLAREEEFLSRRAAPAPAARTPMRMASAMPAMPELPVISRGRPAQRQHIEMPWYSHQGAATRLTGTSPQMIPGMAVDQNLLPPEMRHSSASFTPTSYVASQALANREPFDPYEGRRMEGGNVAEGPGADFARRQMANAARR